MLSLPSEAHLNLCKVIQGSQEDLIINALVVWQVAVLCVSKDLII